ncbi:hypothetical protein Bca4012_031308 [Brassica carinata]|uniref:MATH domain-containing protein n=2 Tax=Brassica TaxID=3705 RepID=A0A0D3BX35_BRAOL|nr:PREDICTED: MATH domain and coiled-coil domain-containing protein At3g58260-like [Brassica oleracea var. oleracea]KAG2287864.1 hypothetical protein Bca52824_047468 [Brassica carinata]
MGSQVDSKFTWVIKNLAPFGSEIICSDSFVISGCKWRLIAYPKRKWLNYLTLEVADCESFPIGWRRLANFSVTIVNKALEQIYRRQVTQQWFDHKTPRLSFPLMKTTLGFLVDEEVKIVAEIDVVEVIINGFQVLPSQVKSVNRLFKREPDIASKFPINNPLLKTAYMNVLLSLTKTLHLSPQKISNGDLSDTETTLAHMKTIGFKLELLEKKICEIKEKKAKEKAGKIKIQNTEEKLKDLKQKCLDLEAQLDTEKAEVLAASAPLLLSDDEDVF